jgi:U3 small nucleolar RNA-associated protein 3
MTRTSADNDDSDDDEEEQEMSSDDDDEEEMDEEAVTDWGRRKSSYFGGDTADLEIGQNADDAYLEEEAAKEVQAARYDQMDEDDFVLSDQEDDDDDAPEKASDSKEMESVSRDLKKLSRAAKRKLLQSHHPELLPLVGHFSEVVKDWNDRTRVASSALFSSTDVTPQVSYIVGYSYGTHP